MKASYTILFVSAVILLTLLTILALTQLSAPSEEYSVAARNFNWISAAITFLNFSFTTVLLVIAHLIIFRKKLPKKNAYILLGLPYLLFIIFTVVNYGYVYELYNIFQEKNQQAIDTPDMEVLAINISMFTLMMAAINLGVIWGLKRDE